MSKKFTTKEQAFLDHLFDEDILGDTKKAKDRAGYSPSTQVSHIISRNKDLAEEVVRLSNQFLAINSPKAVTALVEGIDDPTSLGLNNRLKAVDSLLDRAGLAKKQQLEVETDSETVPILLLPAKVDPSIEVECTEDIESKES